jgi:hypothetical protein
MQLACIASVFGKRIFTASSKTIILLGGGEWSDGLRLESGFTGLYLSWLKLHSRLDLRDQGVFFHAYL